MEGSEEVVVNVSLEPITGKLDEILSYIKQRDQALDELNAELAAVEKNEEALKQQQEAEANEQKLKEEQAKQKKIDEDSKEQREIDLKNMQENIEVLKNISLKLDENKVPDYSILFDELKSQNEKIVLNTTQNESDIIKQQNYDTIFVYAGASIIFVVCIAFPVYFAYRFIRANFALLNNIF